LNAENAVPGVTPPLPGENDVSSSPAVPGPMPVVLSFDVEEHHRIEAAAGLEIDSGLQGEYRERMRRVTLWILEQLAERRIRATFFIVGQVAVSHPELVRSVHEAGHEVASHGWDHRRVLAMTPAALREDVRKSKDALEQACGAVVLGYRAPTFSIVRRTAWALDILAELGLLYDSSIYPVRHDRYGVPDAPRGPFLARGAEREILELPPATLRVGGVNVPVGGGGYFRLLPSPLMRLALRLSRRDPRCVATVLYFHPWEFDPDQPRLPLGPLDRFRTYVGTRQSRQRLLGLLVGHRFLRGVDLARELDRRRERLPSFRPSDGLRRANLIAELLPQACLGK
jgi:polysaccharide deacetylase family protein (PEP-CTERM system associated)